MGNSPFCAYTYRSQPSDQPLTADVGTAMGNPRELDLLIRISNDRIPIPAVSNFDDDIRTIARQNRQLHSVPHLDETAAADNGLASESAILVNERSRKSPSPTKRPVGTAAKASRNHGIVLATTTAGERRSLTETKGSGKIRPRTLHKKVVRITRDTIELSSEKERREGMEMGKEEREGNRSGEISEHEDEEQVGISAALEGNKAEVVLKSELGARRERVFVAKPTPQPKSGSRNPRASQANSIQEINKMWAQVEKSRTGPAFLCGSSQSPAIFPKKLTSPHSIVRPIPAEHVLLKGALLKYHPGFSTFYIPKHCRLTRTAFRYGPGQCRLDSSVPLISISYEDIVSVERVCVELPQKRGERGTRLFQFEIFPKEGWIRSRTGKAKNRPSVVRRSPNSPSGSRSRARTLARSCTVDGHLMLRPMALSRNGLVRNASVPSGKLAIEKPQHRPVAVDRVIFEGERDAKDYIEFVKGNGEKMAQVRRREKIDVKNPRKWIPGVGGLNTWNNRELEWFCAEERLLFAAESIEDCETWVWALNWAIRSARAHQ